MPGVGPDVVVDGVDLEGSWSVSLEAFDSIGVRVYSIEQLSVAHTDGEEVNVVVVHLVDWRGSSGGDS